MRSESEPRIQGCCWLLAAGWLCEPTVASEKADCPGQEKWGVQTKFISGDISEQMLISEMKFKKLGFRAHATLRVASRRVASRRVASRRVASRRVASRRGPG